MPAAVPAKMARRENSPITFSLVLLRQFKRLYPSRAKPRCAHLSLSVS
jgi:hypothetical protein